MGVNIDFYGVCGGSLFLVIIVFGDLDMESTDGWESRVFCWGIGEVDYSWVYAGLGGECGLMF